MKHSCTTTLCKYYLYQSSLELLCKSFPGSVKYYILRIMVCYTWSIIILVSFYFISCNSPPPPPSQVCYELHSRRTDWSQIFHQSLHNSGREGCFKDVTSLTQPCQSHRQETVLCLNVAISGWNQEGQRSFNVHCFNLNMLEKWTEIISMMKSCGLEHDGNSLNFPATFWIRLESESYQSRYVWWLKSLVLL